MRERWRRMNQQETPRRLGAWQNGGSKKSHRRSTCMRNGGNGAPSVDSGSSSTSLRVYRLGRHNGSPCGGKTNGLALLTIPAQLRLTGTTFSTQPGPHGFWRGHVRPFTWTFHRISTSARSCRHSSPFGSSIIDQHRWDSTTSNPDLQILPRFLFQAIPSSPYHACT